MKDLWGLGRRDRDGKRKPAGLCNCPRRRGLDDLAVERSEWIQELLREENWEMQMREVSRRHVRLLESVTLFQVGPPTELGDTRRADAQETLRLQDCWVMPSCTATVLFRRSSENSIWPGVGARCPTQSLFNLGSVRLHCVTSQVTVIMLIYRAAENTGIKGKCTHQNMY